MATPRDARAAAAAAAAGVKPGQGQVSGREARFVFWQTLWFPLAAFLFAGHGPDINRHRYINGLFLLVIQLGMAAYLFLKARENEGAVDALDRWVRFGAYVGGVPNAMCRSLLKPYLFGEELWVGGMKAAYEDILTNAGLAYLIFLYFIFVAGADWRENRACVLCFYPLMIGTTIAVFCVTEDAGLVAVDSLVVYFKTAALVALLGAAPHLYPGLTPRRSSAFLTCIILVVLPLALIGVWLLQQYEVADNDTIIAKVDDYKYHLGAAYLLLHACESIVEWADRE